LNCILTSKLLRDLNRRLLELTIDAKITPVISFIQIINSSTIQITTVHCWRLINYTAFIHSTSSICSRSFTYGFSARSRIVGIRKLKVWIIKRRRRDYRRLRRLFWLFRFFWFLRFLWYLRLFDWGVMMSWKRQRVRSINWFIIYEIF